MPPARKRATPPASLTEKRAANAVSDLDALRNEVTVESGAAPIEYTAVPFAGTVIRVKDFWDWPALASDLLAVGRFTQAAGQIVHPDDFNTIWAKANPTNRQVAAFIGEVEKVIGIPLATLLTSLSS